MRGDNVCGRLDVNNGTTHFLFFLFHFFLQKQECYKKNQTFENLMDSKINKEKSFESLEVAQKSKAAATLTKENAQAQLNNILQLVTYYDQKRALSRQQMMVCNQCPKMKIYQDATAAADISFTKFKAQYTLAEMQQKNADLGVTNATLNSQDAELQAARGVDSVTTLTQDLQAAEKTCDEKFPEEEEAKSTYNANNDKLIAFNKQKEMDTKNEMDRLLAGRRSKSYYFSTRAGSHINMEPTLYDALATTTKGALSVSMWVKLSSLGHDSTLISTRGESKGQIYGWTLGVNSQDGFYFDATTESQTGTERKRMKSGSETIEIKMNVWYNIAVTWGEEKKMYINGYNVARGVGGEILYSSAVDVDAGGKSVTIGALKDGSKWLNGGIDDLALWSRENTKQEIQGRCSKKDSTLQITGSNPIVAPTALLESAANKAKQAVEKVVKKMKKPEPKEGANAEELAPEPTVVFENTNAKQLLFFLNFGPNYDLGTEISSDVEGSGTFNGAVVGNVSVTWIPDEDSKIFCTALSNTKGRKVIRRLSENTALFRMMNDATCQTNTTKCTDDNCAPQNDGGVAIFFTSELFGNGPGQLPNTVSQATKKINNVQLLLSLGGAGKTKEEEPVEEQADEVWIMKGFDITEQNGCVKDSLLDGNTTIAISKFERDEGRLTIDMTAQMNLLASNADSTTPRGVYIMRADTSTATKEGLTFLSSSPEVDATKRPQLVAGVTDGASPPIAFVKGDACPNETHMTCTSKDVEASVGFDGYSERRCGNIENEDKSMVGMTISRATNKLESCERPKGIFCCSRVV